MRIRQRILVGYLAVFLVCTFVGLFALQNICRIHNSYKELFEYHVPAVYMTQDLLLAFEFEALMLRTYLLTGLPDWKEEYLRQKQRTLDILEELENRIVTEDERAVLAPLARSIRQFESDYAVLQLVVREDPLLPEAEKMARIRDLIVEYRGTARNVIALGEDYIAYKQAVLEHIAATNAGWVRMLVVTTAALLGLALVLGVGVTVYISRTISAPLKALDEEARLLTAGDLTTREIEVMSGGEVGQLARSFVRLSEHFRRLVANFRKAAERVIKTSEALTPKVREVHEAAAANKDALNDLAARMNKVVDNTAAVGRTIAGAAARSSAVNDSARKISRQLDVSTQAANKAAQAVQGLIARLDDVGEAVRFSAQLAMEAGRFVREVTRESAYLYEPEGGAEKTGGVPLEPLLALAAEMDRRSQFTSSAAAEIAGLVEDIRVLAEDTAAALAEEHQLIEESQGLALEVAESLAEIVDAVGVLSTHFHEVKELSVQIVQSVDAVSRSSVAYSELVEQIERAAVDLETAARELEETLAGLKI